MISNNVNFQNKIILAKKKKKRKTYTLYFIKFFIKNLIKIKIIIFIYIKKYLLFILFFLQIKNKRFCLLIHKIRIDQPKLKANTLHLTTYTQNHYL